MIFDIFRILDIRYESRNPKARSVFWDLTHARSTHVHTSKAGQKTESFFAEIKGLRSLGKKSGCLKICRLCKPLQPKWVDQSWLNLVWGDILAVSWHFFVYFWVTHNLVVAVIREKTQNYDCLKTKQKCSWFYRFCSNFGEKLRLMSWSTEAYRK